MALRIERVLISDEIDDICIEELQKNGIEAVRKTKLTRSELIEEIKHYDGLIVRSATKVDAEILQAGNRLKVVGRAGVGVDNIDCNIATSQGILVLNTPDGNTLSAAEHTCAMILSLVRHIPQATASMKSGKWDRKSFMGSELNGKTLAVLGFGRIGREVAIRMQSFGMKVIAYDPCLPKEIATQLNITLLSLEEIWPLADFITIHTPLLPQTKNLLNKTAFEKCKKGFRVVNCARGGIIEEHDLLDALNSGKCAGAGLDVFIQEPPKEESHALINHAKVISTPHLGASTDEAQYRVALEVSQAFVTVSSGKGLPGAINGRALVQALDPKSQKWVKLITTLGKLLASQLKNANELQIKVELSIRELLPTQAPPSYVEAAVAAGLLSFKLGQAASLNLINAPSLAKQHGINVQVAIVSNKSNTDVVTVGSGETSVSGILCGDSPALLSVAGDKLLQPLLLDLPNSQLFILDKSTSLNSSQYLAASFGIEHLYVLASTTTGNNKNGFSTDPIVIA